MIAAVEIGITAIGTPGRSVAQPSRRATTRDWEEVAWADEIAAELSWLPDRPMT